MKSLFQTRGEIPHASSVPKRGGAHVANSQVGPNVVVFCGIQHECLEPDLEWAGYEASKRFWVEMNPNATPSQYEAAMQAIATRYGI